MLLPFVSAGSHHERNRATCHKICFLGAYGMNGGMASLPIMPLEV